MRLKAGLTALVVSCLGAGLLAAEAQKVFAPGKVGAAARGFRGLVAVRGGRVLASEHSSQLFVPASVLKLLVSAAALHHLGPAHRRVTTVAAAGALAGGVLAGDLVLQGSGDPTWNRRFHRQNPREPLDELARQVRGAGLRRVTGDLVVDASRFPGPAWAPNVPGADRMLLAAPVSAAAVDENVIPVRVGPGPRAGTPGAAPEALGSVRLLNLLVTVGPERKGRGTLEFVPSLDGTALAVRGEYPANEPAYEVEVSHPAPELHAGQELLEALRRAGVEVQGGVRVSRTAVAAAAGAALARIESPPLSEVLRPILEKSQNWYAEMLLRIVALEVAGSGRLDLGLDVERELLEEQIGVPAGAFWLEDGSGLSPTNLVTPDAIAALLDWALRQPWKRAFLDALAASGQGTLAGWGELPPLRAKTGTLQATVGLAGYLAPERPDPVVFAAFLNHRPGDAGGGRAEIAGFLRRWAGQ